MTIPVEFLRFLQLASYVRFWRMDVRPTEITTKI
jgi:hypothetical protein